MRTPCSSWEEALRGDAFTANGLGSSANSSTKTAISRSLRIFATCLANSYPPTSETRRSTRSSRVIPPISWGSYKLYSMRRVLLAGALAAGAFAQQPVLPLSVDVASDHIVTIRASLDPDFH